MKKQLKLRRLYIHIQKATKQKIVNIEKRRKEKRKNEKL